MGKLWRVLAVVSLVSGVVVGVVPSAAVMAPASAAMGVGDSVSYGGGDLQPVDPARILDTRKGIGGPQGRLGVGEVLSLKVTGVGGVPSVGVGAVVLNLTGIAPTAVTYVTAWPHGADRPVASVLNLKAHEVRPNLVVVKVGRGGLVDLYNYNGQVDLAADVSGWFPDASGLQPLVPARILDTRKGIGAPKARLGSQGTLGLQVTGQGGIPATGVDAVVVNLTGISPSAETYLTAWPAGITRPLASNLNLRAGDVTPNLAIVKVGAGGGIDLFNNNGQVDVVVDVVGWFPTGSAYEPLDPARILDTRNGLGAPRAPLASGSTIPLKVTGVGGVPTDDVGAVVLNLTGITPSAPETYVTASPTGVTRPVASNLNLTRGSVVPNLVVVKVGTGGRIDLYNYVGNVDLAADVVGWFPTGGDALTMITPADGTVLAGPGDITTTTVDPDFGGTVTFAPSADIPSVGGHFAYAGGPGAGPGISGEVIASTNSPDGTTTATYGPANLQDIFTDLEIHQPTGTAARAGALPGPQQNNPDTLPNRWFALDGNRNDSSCSVNGAPVSLPTISFGSFIGSADFSLRHASARIEMGGTLTLQWAVSITGSVSCGITLAGGPLGWIGPVEIGWEVDANISISADAEATATVSIPVTVGFEYDDGQADNLSSADLIGTADGDANAELSAGFEGTISTKLFGVVGVNASLTPALNVSLSQTAGNPPEACVTLSASIGVGIGAEVEKWGVGWDFDIAQTTLAEKDLYTSPGCADMQWSGTITVDDVVEHHCGSSDDCSPGYTDSNWNRGQLTLLSAEKLGDEEYYRSVLDYTSTFRQHDAIELGGDEPCTINKDDFSEIRFPGVIRRGVYISKLGSDWLIRTGGFNFSPDEPQESGEATGSASHHTYGCGSDETTTSGPFFDVTGFPQWLDAFDNNFGLGLLMPDSDPDPNRLTGTIQLSAYDPQNNELWVGSETITISYDLQRVPVPNI